MSREEVYCCDCDHAMRQGPSYAWMCQQAPRYGTGFVTRDKWDDDPPYERCIRINKSGNCRWFKEAPCAPSET